ncbi:ribosomal-protein-alanine N-acetyltransferase [Microbacterium protaetiae]|uniref:Ribosomal-protein-alanine N-acetyltransferase n=2 Tax=Microbacterium protaetiae TaxID=2509458 RepID=A0A4P6EGU7_9MICO|nr:ribosomal-protein-alanine N-acetyltransferase [Microbacterium protaetiae]
MALERASFPTDAWGVRTMRDELVSPHGRYLVLEHDGALVGYAGLRAVAGSRDGDVQTIAVAAASRGNGWGRMLLLELIAEAYRRGVRDLFLEVRADNPVAQALYVSEGFHEVGRRPRYYQPDDVDAIVMQADLRRSDVAPAFKTQPESTQTAENRSESAVRAETRGVLNAARPDLNAARPERNAERPERNAARPEGSAQ